jgi:hypothetical protein
MSRERLLACASVILTGLCMTPAIADAERQIAVFTAATTG